ncbi:MAG: TIGR00296 family protein [Thermoplasmata archaeon]
MRTDPDGIAAVRLARRSIVTATGGGRSGAPGAALPPGFEEPRGVFVTIRRHPSGTLRGCIGYPLPRYPLATAIDRAARSAAVDDPRFPPVRASELAALTVEVSVLTVPVPLTYATPEEAIRQVEVGRDGLIVEARGTSGLLVPQVAPEQGWDAEQLLDGTCEKADLPPRAWRSPGVRLFRFEAEVFGEATPSGAIVRAGDPVTSADARRGPRR